MTSVVEALLGSPARAASTPVDLRTLPIMGAQMSPYEPGLRERIGNTVYDAANAIGMSSIANRMRLDAENAVDFVPGLGDAVGFNDAARDLSAGNYGSALLNAGASTIGAIPGGGDLAAGALKAIFGGVGAATADKAMLMKAQDLADAGADRLQIWNETGWFKGGDGRWRFEIDDSASKLVDPFETDEMADRYINASVDAVGRKGLPTALPLDDVLRHPELQAAYPNIPENGVLFDNSTGLRGARGSYNESNDMITLDSGMSIVDPAAQRSTTLHELQHAVQAKEGFARGGSTETSLEAFAKYQKQKLDEMSSTITGLMEANPDVAKLYRLRNQAMISKDFEAMNALEEQLMALPEGSTILGLDWERSALYHAEAPAPHEAYRRLAGEVEARNVQTRMNMTPEQRLATPPWETQDTPDELLIFRMGQ